MTAVTASHPSQRYRRFGSYLHGQHFMTALLVAMVIHLGGVALYQILPREVIEMIPVRVLNIKLGTPRVTTPMPSAPAPATKPAAPALKPAAPAAKIVKAPVVKPVVKKPAPVKPKAAPPKDAVAGKSISEVAKEMAKAKQFVREDAMPAVVYDKASGIDNTRKDGLIDTENEGSALGNSTADSAEIEARYTQTLSLWINRFKIYPEEARQAGIGGTVMLRIRINRQGRILQYYLERPSGHALIDRATSAMVEAANPVPAVPPYYPDPRPYLEFLVPIHFKP